MNTSLRRFLARPGAEQRAALLALTMAPLVKLMLRSRGYVSTARALGRVARSPASNFDQAVARAGAAHGVMRRLPYEMTCLERSLVVWWLLGGDTAGSIRFGVAPGETGQAPNFHAWVEVEGRPIDDGVEHVGSFLPLSPQDLPQPGRFD